MLGAAMLEAAAVWVEYDGPLRGPVAPVWLLVRGVLEIGVGAVLLRRVVGIGMSPVMRQRLCGVSLPRRIGAGVPCP